MLRSTEGSKRSFTPAYFYVVKMKARTAVLPWFFTMVSLMARQAFRLTLIAGVLTRGLWNYCKLILRLLRRFCDGVRDEAGVNQKEIKCLLLELEILLGQSGAKVAATQPSVGILSPFRNQVEAIREAISKHFDNREMNRLLGGHHMLIGTAHSFQGEERDVMFLSLSIDRHVNSSTLRFLERDDVFNVAITRARSMQIIYHSLGAEDLPEGSMLGDYLRSLDEVHSENFEEKTDDAFAREVALALDAYDVEVRFGQRVSGVSVDLLLIQGDRVLGIDLMGYPGVTFPAVDRHRTKILRRANFRLLPLGYTEWCIQKDHVITTILQQLRQTS